MDQRAKVPVTLPPSNPTKSYWQDPPDEIADLRTTEDLPDHADVVIIGSGITGAAVAWELLQEQQSLDDAEKKSMVMLEARQACSGATGRNGGHTKAASYRSFLDHASRLGTEAALQIARLELANIKAVHTFAREYNIDCDLNACDTIDVIYDEAQWHQAQEAVAAICAAVHPDDDPLLSKYTFYTPAEVEAKFHCAPSTTFQGREERVQGGVVYFAGSLSAYKFGIGVLKLCLATGQLNLQTNTPAISLTRDGTTKLWTITTPRGRITTPTVILATNGYTAHLLPQFQGVIVPLRGQIAAHRPGSLLPHGGSLPTTYSFIYDKGYEYMVPRPPGSRFEGDIIMGGGLVRGNTQDEGLSEYGTTDDTTLNKEISAYLHETTPRYFGRDHRWGEDHPEGRVRMEWTGIMGYSPDGFPFVGEMPPGQKGLWVSCGFQGHGMVLCWMCARALIAMMSGKEEGWKSWFPDAFRVSEERMGVRFEGRLHASAAPPVSKGEVAS